MHQPAVIVEWWGPYDTLGEVCVANKDFDGREPLQALCMALSGDTSGGSRYRYIISWHQPYCGAASFPDDDRLRNADIQSFYLGWIASFNAETTWETAEWSLIHALSPKLNEPPAPCPPGWNNADPQRQYCGSVCSWFYGIECGEKRDPPPGLPTVIAFNSYNDPPDEERVLRLQLDGCV